LPLISYALKEGILSIFSPEFFIPKVRICRQNFPANGFIFPSFCYKKEFIFPPQFKRSMISHQLIPGNPILQRVVIPNANQFLFLIRLIFLLTLIFFVQPAKPVPG
jgi:hypothetical protein